MSVKASVETINSQYAKYGEQGLSQKGAFIRNSNRNSAAMIGTLGGLFLLLGITIVATEILISVNTQIPANKIGDWVFWIITGDIMAATFIAAGIISCKCACDEIKFLDKPLNDDQQVGFFAKSIELNDLRK